MLAIFPKGMRKKAGLAPGTLLPVEEKKVEKVIISLMDFDETHLEEKTVGRVRDCFPFRDTPAVTWMNVEGIHDLDMLREWGEMFNLHPLVLEDILNVNQRPKLEDYGDYLFVVMKYLFFDENNGSLSVEQMSIVLGKNYVLTFQEKSRGIFESLRKRIRDPNGRIRKRSVSYLFYAIIDVIIDSYFVVLEHMGEGVEGLEEKLMRQPEPELLRLVFDAKVNMLVMRRAIWPVRDLTNVLVRAETELIQSEVELFLHDLYDHTVQLIETVEVSREMVQSLVDLHLSVVNNRMNEIMKVLTLMATIFIPLTFLAGVYGMNFKYMPELEWRPAYFVVWSVMIVIAGGLVVLFKRKRWF